MVQHPIRCVVRFRRIAATVLTFIVAAGIVAGCGQTSPPSGKTDVPVDSQAGSNAGAVDKPVAIPENVSGPPSDATGCWLLEIVSVSSDRPLANPVQPRRPRGAELNGYVFEPASGGAPGRLYPAMGDPPPARDDVDFWIGYRILDLSPRFAYDKQRLIAVKGRSTIENGQQPSREELRSNGASLAAERPRAAIHIELRPSGFHVEVFEKEFTIGDGEAVLLNETAPRNGEGISYHRLVAAAYADVQVADFDAAQQWQLSKDLLRNGPYEAALSATERVLLAAPDHEEALRRWSKARALIEAGSVPSVLEVHLVFPPGVDAEQQITDWKADPVGMVTLADSNSPPRAVQTGARVASETVRVPAPSGRYRFALHLPGFRSHREEIEIDGHTKLELELVPAP